MREGSNNAIEDMHTQVDWMRPSDRPILMEIANYGGWIKPASLSFNLPYTRKHIADRTREMAEHGLLDRHKNAAAYRVTELGRDFLANGLDPEQLRD